MLCLSQSDMIWIKHTNKKGKIFNKQKYNFQ
jgi:hypothetical protein